MSFEKKVPEWLAAGTEPPASLKEQGFGVGYKPPADFFNWFWHGISEAVKELQGATPRDFGALAESAVYYSSATEIDIDTATQSLLLVDKKWAKDCPLCKDSGFVFIMQLFFGEPSQSVSKTQVAVSYGDGGNSVAKGIAIRCCFSGNWSGWTELYGPHNKPTPSDVGAAPVDHKHNASDINAGELDSNRLPVVPVSKGGTEASGWHQALKNLNAMGRLAMYYSSTYEPDIDTLTDSLMLVPYEYSKECPVGGGFVYIMQVFYGDTSASSNRTQIAFPYFVDGSIGKGMATRSCYNGTWSKWDELASTYNHQIKTYSSLAEIGLTAGSETIADIANKLGAWSELLCATGSGNANIYPDIYGMLRVTSVDSSRVRFLWTSKSVNVDYVGVYSFSNTTPWTGWKKVYNEAYPPTPAEIGAASTAEMQRRDRVVDLIDNGYFPEAINQREVTTTTAWKHCLDRWIAREAGIGIAIDENGMHMSSTEAANVFIYQKLKTPAAQMLGKTYTLAVCDSNGNIACNSVTLPTAQPAIWSIYGTVTLGNISACMRVVATGEHGIAFSVGRTSNNTDDANVRWVALYPGSYTLDTLPDYVPKENTLAECQKYAVKTNGHGWGYTVSSTTLRLNIPVPTTLRVTPSIPEGIEFTVVIDGTVYTVTEYTVAAVTSGIVRLTLTGTGFPTARTPVVGYANKDFVFSADV